MSTRSVTKIYEPESIEPIVRIYRHPSGHPSVHGMELAAYLAEITVLDGVHCERDLRKQANGMGSLAVGVIGHLTTLLEPCRMAIDSVDASDAEYIYEVHLVDSQLEMIVYQRTQERWDDPPQQLWSGPPKDFEAWVEEGAAGLPKLQGEPDQIVEAKQIRKQILGQELGLRSRIRRAKTANRVLDKIVRELKAMDSAVWWLQHPHYEMHVDLTNRCPRRRSPSWANVDIRESDEIAKLVASLSQEGEEPAVDTYGAGSAPLNQFHVQGIEDHPPKNSEVQS
jgi:hypothetical protein